MGARQLTDQTPMVGQEYYPGPSNDIDWTTRGGVSRVKNQGQCGSCWAFSGTGAMESRALIGGMKDIDLSEQQLVDCAKPDNYGCSGGWSYKTFIYTVANGLASQSEYPYTGVDGNCARQGGSFKIAGYNFYNGCPAIADQLTALPVSVTVDASNWSFYRVGIFSNCGTNTNHAVLLVGVVGGDWKIKNSWGTSWGENGFIRLLGQGNTCGICQWSGFTPY